MIETKKLLPAVYSDSFDFSIFTGILDVVYNGRDFDLSLIKGLHAPSYVAEENLPALSRCFNLPPASRELLKAYRHLIKIKGTIPAIEAAIQLAGAVPVPVLVSGESSMSWGPFYDIVDQTTRVTYFVNSENLKRQLLTELLQRIVPVTADVLVKEALE